MSSEWSGDGDDGKEGWVECVECCCMKKGEMEVCDCVEMGGVGCEECECVRKGGAECVECECVRRGGVACVEWDRETMEEAASDRVRMRRVEREVRRGRGTGRERSRGSENQAVRSDFVPCVSLCVGSGEGGVWEGWVEEMRRRKLLTGNRRLRLPSLQNEK